MNRQINNHKTIKLDSLKESQRTDFIDKLYFVNNKIFSGVDRQTFSSYIFNPKATSQKVMLLHNETAIIGYCAVHFFKVIANNKYHVIRAEAGILPEYRGNSPLSGFMFIEIFKYALRHAFRNVYYLGTLVHPSSYHNFNKFCDLVYPSLNQETPQIIINKINELVQYFDIKRHGNVEDLTCDVGWCTREEADEQLRWQQRKEEDIKYYLRRNPAYKDGVGLITIIPCTFINLLSVLRNLFTAAYRDENHI